MDHDTNGQGFAKSAFGDDDVLSSFHHLVAFTDDELSIPAWVDCSGTGWPFRNDTRIAMLGRARVVHSAHAPGSFALRAVINRAVAHVRIPG
ncbi:MAG: hypothetical protein AB7P16_24950 [Bradyrhizobium sp.]|uniref:hypothetical protein n=1 Tax=Bradyrhizobium sp. TaxID=376 RepID=UPI003D15308A